MGPSGIIRRCVRLALLGIAAPLLLSVPPAAGAETLRYLQYWSSYGDKITPPGDYKDLSFTLSGGNVSVSMAGKDDVRSNFTGPAPRGLREDLSALVARMDLSGWDTPISEKASDSIPYEKRDRYCRWNMVLVFEPGEKGKSSREVRLAGADHGVNKGRVAVENALAEFFALRLAQMQASVPRKIGNVSWQVPSPNGMMYYHASRHDNGREEVSRHGGGKKRGAYVQPGFLDSLQKEMRGFPVDSWHGFKAPELDSNAPSYMYLLLEYDTSQNVWVRGHAEAEGGLPAGMAELAARLSALCDKILDAGGGPVPARRDALKSFSFGESGMRMGRWPGYEIYQRMEENGPAMVLEREMGQEKDACLMQDGELKMFEALLGELGIAKWNGFSGSDSRVLDGTTFGLYVHYWDGRSISAHGYMRFPGGYRDSMRRIYGFLDGVLAKNGFPRPR